MVTTDRGPVQTARQSLASARQTLINNLYQFEQATDALREVKRRHGSGTSELADAQSAFDTAQAAFNQARDAEAASVNALQSQLAAWLPDGTTPEADVGRLPASEPIVLFPVRLETRLGWHSGAPKARHWEQNWARPRARHLALPLATPREAKWVGLWASRLASQSGRHSVVQSEAPLGLNSGWQTAPSSVWLSWELRSVARKVAHWEAL